jgi:amidohydrolase
MVAWLSPSERHGRPTLEEQSVNHLKEITKDILVRIREPLFDLSHRIHANPEIAFQEKLACQWIAAFLSDNGFQVETGICGLPTAFRSRRGSGSLQMSVCAEYDALPQIGHACGHNIIAAAAAGATIAAAAVADEIGITLEIIGTPGEEMGNAAGKVLLLERGAFAETHAALMVHPGPVDVAAPPIIAMSMLDVEYRGREAHASAFPEYGVNAADALTVAQISIAFLRQHIRKTDRLHGITIKAGEAPNIIPAHTTARYFVRASDLEEIAEVKAKVVRCFEAGALATGSTLNVVGGDKPNAQMVHDPVLVAIYRQNCETLGRTFEESAIARAAISTDMGNVSLAVPSIHPMIGINSLPAVNHQAAFAAHCTSEAGDQAVFDGALALAGTIIDAVSDRHVRRHLLSCRETLSHK